MGLINQLQDSFQGTTKQENPVLVAGKPWRDACDAWV